MWIITSILLFFALIRLAVAFCNWLTQPFLPKAPETNTQPSVSILIPARNEEKNISRLLSDLEKFTYESLEIIVYNDNSSDNTAQIVNSYATKQNNIKLIEGMELESGWLGKNHACYHLAKAAKNDYLLFLDADVRVENGLIEDSIYYLTKNNLSLLSIFPKQIMPNIKTQISVPLMNWILLSLLPLILIRKSNWKSFSAANGQFMLFKSSIYKQLEPHKHFKNNKVEDIAIIRYFKEKKLKTNTLLGDYRISCTMYQDLSEGIDGFSKNIFQFFGGSIIASFLFVATTTLAPFYILYFASTFEIIIYFTAIVLIRLFVSLASKQNVWKNVLLIIPQHFILIVIVIKAFVYKNNKNLQWKDRKIYTLF